MSANLVVDLGNGSQLGWSFPNYSTPLDGGLLITSGGAISSLSGVMVGDSVNLNNADTFCNLIAVGKGFGSGPLLVGVQTSDTDTSGTFTDPTSGLAQLPTSFSSGGWLIIGSGNATDGFRGIFGSGVSGQIIQSGFAAAGGFQRPHTFARVIVGSGFYDGTLMAGFVSQFRTTGSGGGWSWQPASSGQNTINV